MNAMVNRELMQLMMQRLAALVHNHCRPSSSCSSPINVPSKPINILPIPLSVTDLFPSFQLVLSLWLRVCLSVRAINRSTSSANGQWLADVWFSQRAGFLLLLLHEWKWKCGLWVCCAVVLTVYPAESWTPRVRAHEYLSHCYSIYHGTGYKITGICHVCLSTLAPTVAIFTRLWLKVARRFGTRNVRSSSPGVRIWPFFAVFPPIFSLMHFQCGKFEHRSNEAREQTVTID